jgi:predicted DNA-binding transcriptional regulator AlpA
MGRRVIRKPLVEYKTGYSSQHICRLERQGLFPKRIHLQPGGAVGWFEDQVDAWLQARATARDQAATNRNARIAERTDGTA